jgi:hypothetical protein
MILLGLDFAVFLPPHSYLIIKLLKSIHTYTNLLIIISASISTHPSPLRLHTNMDSPASLRSQRLSPRKRPSPGAMSLGEAHGIDDHRRDASYVPTRGVHASSSEEENETRRPRPRARRTGGLTPHSVSSHGTGCLTERSTDCERAA